MLRRAVLSCAAALLGAASVACGDEKAATPVAGPAPDSFHVAFETSRGRIVVAANRAWSPNGVARFHELTAEQFFDEQRFFRVLPNYIAQFGAGADLDASKRWKERKIPDDPRVLGNTRGTISFAHDGPGTRTHQLFINLKDNPRLDAQGFVPIGRVVEGMAVADSINDEYGETPRYHLIATLGNSYLRRMFPRLDFIKTARIVAP